MALANYNFGSDDLFAPFFGQAMMQRSGTDSAGVRGIPLDVIEVRYPDNRVCTCMHRML